VFGIWHEYEYMPLLSIIGTRMRGVIMDICGSGDELGMMVGMKGTREMKRK